MTQITSVRPGDLIRADDFNAVLAKLRELEGRVSNLESVNPAPGAVVIVDVTPTSPKVGDDIRISGRNFGLSIGANRIDFNGTPPNFLRAGSSDSLLICDVPDIPNLPAAGGPVTLTVHNQFSSAAKQIVVTPATPTQVGTVDTLLDGTSPTTITAGQDNLFQIRLRSRAKLGVTMSLTATVSPADWQPSVAILDAFRNPLGSARLTLQPFEERTVFIKVSIPAGTNGTPFTLTVSGGDEGVITSSGRLDFVVGQATNLDNSFTAVPSGSSPAGALSGMTITAASGSVTQVNGRADFTVAGNYELTLQPAAGTTGWTLVVTSPAADANGKHILPVLASEIPAGGVAQKTFQFRVRPATASTPAGQAQLTVQRQGASTLRTMTFRLVAS